MCGILGTIDFSKRFDRNRERFEQALLRQHHRGPDDSGIFETDHCLLGHRRLSILDLDSRSAQPMVTRDSKHVLIYNGEIYNFRELKEDLRRRGIEFCTESDTEVLLLGLVTDGIEFIERCIGMFAFCYVDMHKREAHLVRDRLGIKPLYYQAQGGRISFSSTLESLNLIAEPGSYSLEALSSYLSFRYPLGDRTYFSGVTSLGPGERLVVRASGIDRLCYWDPCEIANGEKVDKGEAYYLQRLTELIRSSVAYRLVSDVPVGAYLSGGVDSSGLVATMADFSNTPIKTFTIGFDLEGYNEFEPAAEVARQYGTDHYEIRQSPDDYLEAMEDLIRLKGAPLAVPNEVPIWRLSQQLRKHITVVLSGEGADELFMGYGRIFRSAFDFERLQSGYVWSSPEARATFLENARARYGETGFASELDHFLHLYSYTPFTDKQALLSRDIPLPAIEENLREDFEQCFDKVRDATYEDRISYTFLKLHLPGLLQRLDNATMAASVEGRVPFIDHRLVEFVLSMPVHYKLRWLDGSKREHYEALTSDKISEVYDTPKYALKKVFEPLLSDNILYRNKVAFPVPLHTWFKGNFRNTARDLLLSKTARERGIYNNKSLEHLLQGERVEKDPGAAQQLWMLMNNEMFMRACCD
ncbi:asparagine synthase (glutamine-hydrolyzing) [Elongatibacter sediminis]|uniref:asparagine synthase (glutamine-hydrolyzing) n=1 Tax=Elongatibacter sediminis TaxID=3119006 RepID=A0AAW9RL17_9GAMM